VLGAIGQQVVTVWKTSKDHRQELQRRIFDARFKTATEVTVTLSSTARFFRAWLAEAEEWTRGDSRYDVLAARQQVVDQQVEALTSVSKESERAFALMEFLFPPAVWLFQHKTTIVEALVTTWQRFEQQRVAFKTELDKRMPPERTAELRIQRQTGTFSPGVNEELQLWFTYYEEGLRELRDFLPSLRQYTSAYDVETHAAIQTLRSQFQAYES